MLLLQVAAKPYFSGIDTEAFQLPGYDFQITTYFITLY